MGRCLGELRRNSVHERPKPASRGHFCQSVYTPAYPRLSATVQQCTQVPRNGPERPFLPICVHSCVAAHEEASRGGFDGVLARKARSRPGNVKIDGEAKAKIVALTYTDPPEGHARWTLRLIAEKSVELGYVESISHVAVGNILKKGTS